jgi:hypothetical protein
LGSTRLYVIVARKAPIAVVFRRGPTRQVELLSWNLETDEVTAGQWLKGRIYERRCDLSPSGKLLIYFAAKYETELRTWTAISRPPYLTALALWPKGDAWGGGGLFDTERRIRLNHRPDEMKLGNDFRLAPSMEVVPLGDQSGRHEDNPILHDRLVRDGWRWVDTGSVSTMHEQGASHFVTFDPPIRYERNLGRPGRSITLEMSVEAIHERGGAWYVLTYRLVRGATVDRDLGRADWADAAPNGDLLLAREGQLLRLSMASDVDVAGHTFEVVADLGDHRFERRTAPVEVTRW